jgi:hypothetical protein
MRTTICFLLSFSLVLPASAALAQAPTTNSAAAKNSTAKDDAHRRQDIARHRQMARAHEDAARCLEAGEKESTCQDRLREACKGIAVGRYCGMRHDH